MSRLRRSVFRALLVAVGGYLLLVGTAWAFQRRLVYHPERLAGPVPRSAGPGAEVVEFPSGDGTRLTGIWVPPPDDAAPVVLFAHGNGGNALTWRGALEPYEDLGLGALLLDPRGYGWSDGSPDERGWHADAEAAVRWLAARGVGSDRLVLHGTSLGSGLVVPLAARHPVRALVLVAPISSLVDAASAAYPFFPSALLLRDRYDNVAAAPGCRCPVLVLHGADDALVPLAHARRLVEAFGDRARLLVVPDAGHDDVPRWPGYRPALAEFLGGLR